MPALPALPAESDAPAIAPMLQIVDLHKSFGEREVLKGVSLEVFPGEIAVLMGGSGSGKSTTMKCLIGALTPDRGDIFIDGIEIAHLGEDAMDAVRRKYGVLFQSAALFNSLSVANNVALPIRHHTDLPASTIDIMIKLKLELVGLRDAESLMPDQLSGGMKKRVGLARALALDPQIVFYDEPSAGLDPIGVSVVDKLIVNTTRKLNITSFVITHDMHSAFRIADRLFLLHNGRLVASGTPDEFRASDDPLVVQFIHGDAEGPMTADLTGDGRRFIDDLLDASAAHARQP